MPATVGRRAGVALTAVLLTRVALLAVPPSVSDTAHYEYYAASVTAMVAEKLSTTGLDAATTPVARAPSTAERTIVEYPPLAIVFMAVAGIGSAERSPSDPTDYADRFRTVLFAIDLLIVLLLVAVARRSASDQGRPGIDPWPIVMYGSAGAALAYLLYDRLDLVVGALLLLSLTLLLRGSWRSSFVLLALAVNFKAAPIVIAPLWIVGALPLGSWSAGIDVRRLAQAVVTRSVFLVTTTALMFVPFLLVGGARALDFLRFNAERGVQIESVASSILVAIQPLGGAVRVVYQSGALEIESAATPLVAALSPVLLAIAVLWVTGVIVVRRVRGGTPWVQETADRGDRLLAAFAPQSFVAATLLLLLLTLILSKVLSPQYLLWILPIVPLLVSGQSNGRLFQSGFVAVCLLSAIIFPVLYPTEFHRIDAAGMYLDPGVLGTLVLLIRNGLLIGLTLLLVRPAMQVVARSRLLRTGS